MELGSEFNLDLNDLTKKINNVEDYFSRFKIRCFDYGRSAIKSIKINRKKAILLPEFICESVIRCFPLEWVHFYKITKDFRIDYQNLLAKIDNSVGTIYICHYFGYAQDQSKLYELKQIGKAYDIKFIEDTTQSVFSCNDIIGDVAVSSLRKWIPIPHGAMLYSYDNLSDIADRVNIVSSDHDRLYAMMLKDIFLKNLYDTNFMYREIFKHCENKIDMKHSVAGMSDFVKFMLRCFSVREIIDKRIHNYKRLGKYLSDNNISYRLFAERECPLVLPLRVKQRDSFRNYLMDNKVYCAIHWPFDNIKRNERKLAEHNADELISLPIDQRYGDREIDYLCNVISKYGKNLQ